MRIYTVPEAVNTRINRISPSRIRDIVDLGEVFIEYLGLVSELHYGVIKKTLYGYLKWKNSNGLVLLLGDYLKMHLESYWDLF